MVSATDLYTEAGDSPGRQGEKSEHIGAHVSDEQRRQTVCSAGQMYRSVALTTRVLPCCRPWHRGRPECVEGHRSNA